MRRGWEAEFKDGRIVKETEIDWNKLSRDGIVRLTLHYEGRRWDLIGKEAYTQKKRGSAVPGIKDSFMIESRSVGYYEGNKKVWYTVNEHTGAMNITIEENN